MLKLFQRHGCRIASGHHLEAVSSTAQKGALQIDEVAGKVQRDDLSRAASYNLVAASETSPQRFADPRRRAQRAAQLVNSAGLSGSRGVSTAHQQEQRDDRYTARSAEREAFARGLYLVDLRVICFQPEDYSNPSEPSAKGGDKIAAVIAAMVSADPAPGGPSTVWGHG